MRTLFLPFILLLVTTGHSPAQGLDGEQSAQRIAQKVLGACGGEDRWEETRYFHWNFFGIRELWWDKQEHRVRIEIPNKDLVLISDLDDLEGKAWSKGTPVKDSAQLEELMRMSRRIWINDSYWLFMPFKMLDPGVHLKHLGQDTLEGKPMHKLQMTFEEGVGVTPQNKYHVWVDREDHLVRKWAYFSKRSDKEADMETPWKGYSLYNGLKLSSDRGEKKIRDISVPDRFPQGTFSERDP